MEMGFGEQLLSCCFFDGNPKPSLYVNQQFGLQMMI